MKIPKEGGTQERSQIFAYHRSFGADEQNNCMNSGKII